MLISSSYSDCLTLGRSWTPQFRQNSPLQTHPHPKNKKAHWELGVWCLHQTQFKIPAVAPSENHSCPCRWDSASQRFKQGKEKFICHLVLRQQDYNREHVWKSQSNHEKFWFSLLGLSSSISYFQIYKHIKISWTCQNI